MPDPAVVTEGPSHMRKTRGLRAKARPVSPVKWRIRLLRVVFRTIFQLIFRIQVSGLANVPRTQVIICPNHLSWADSLLVLLFFPVQPRIYALARYDEAYKTAFRRWILGIVEVVVPLKERESVQALRTMTDILERGGSLLIFPEGAVAGSQEGSLLPLQHGASHLSLSSGVPILPVGITGTREMWLRRTLTMRVGRPIDLAQFSEGNRRARTLALTTRLEEDLLKLLPGDHERPRIKLLRKWLSEKF
ncbi:MAG TPA: lysophospholipid acyltransferase family protein [Chloroflexia bacterium]|nr:lysophospholipid acyltransferase family protein [Chloroflexia bacterium]